MQLPGEMNVQGLALLGGGPEAGDEGAVLTARMFDTDGDGRNDLFLIDADNDGTVDGAIRALDSDHDGVNDTFVQYDEDGEIQAIGRLDPASREFDVVPEDSEEFDDLVSSLSLTEAAAPDEALFTTFDDPYFIEYFGSTGEDVPGAFEEGGVYADTSLTEVDESDLGSLDAGATIDPGDNAPGQADAALQPDEPESAPLEQFHERELGLVVKVSLNKLRFFERRYLLLERLFLRLIPDRFKPGIVVQLETQLTGHFPRRRLSGA